MFVVSIIGILASIAIPNYMGYQIRAKTAEGTIMVETIAYLEQVRILERGSAIACEPSPPDPPPSVGAVFVRTPAWADLGLQVSGRVRYQYEVRQPAKKSFVVFARADLDADGTSSVFRLDSATMELEHENPFE